MNYLSIALIWCGINFIITLSAWKFGANMFYVSMYFLIGYVLIIICGFIKEVKKQKNEKSRYR